MGRYSHNLIPLFLFALFVSVFPLQVALGKMQSQNYVIYENVLHTFDGPVISDVAVSVAGQSATVTWTTSVIADSFVIYDTAADFSSSKEQGSSAKISSNHSVIITGLEAATLYNFRVRSERVNGGATTDETPRNFTTGTDASEEQPEAEQVAGGGGGILIIDKTDKKEPEITDVEVSGISADAVTVNWNTDEGATSFIEYGPSAAYGSVYGEWTNLTEHSVTIPNLEAGRQYFFRVLSSDSWGNVGYSTPDNFSTLTAGEEGEPPIEGETPAVPDEPSIIADATQRAFEFIGRLFPEVSLNLRPDDLSGIDNLDDLAGLISAPVLSGEPRVDAGATEATISWTTDLAANSLVAIAPTDRYRPGASEPYLQVVGDLETLTTEHAVTLYGLTPDTEYHFQLRSKAGFGPTARSRDFIFRTRLEDFTITSFFSQIIDPQTAVFKWVTNKEADSSVSFAPYRNNVLAVDESKTVRDSLTSTIHEITINEFQGGTLYEIELTSIDAAGNVAKETLNRFSTAEDDLPPEISHVKADSTVFLQGDKIQTIISWLTNEPATSRIFFREGVHGGINDLTESTPLNSNYTKEHVLVIPKFKPGVVYSIRAESIDSGGNISLSPAHTFMTAKKKESIIQVILRILEETFGWIKKIG